jgi:hypothetical protein
MRATHAEQNEHKNEKDHQLRQSKPSWSVLWHQITSYATTRLLRLPNYPITHLPNSPVYSMAHGFGMYNCSNSRTA